MENSFKALIQGHLQGRFQSKVTEKSGEQKYDF